MEPKGISRKHFLKIAGITGLSLCLGIYLPAGAKEPRIVTPDELDESEIELCPWIRIAPDGQITLISHRAEMGQGVYHSIAQIIAEELEADLWRVNIEFAQGNSTKYGNQITGGSSTIRTSYKNLLKLSATARTMLIEAAAAQWGVPPAECFAELGSVLHRYSKKNLHYGKLVAAASALEPPKNVVLKERSEYKLIRQPLLRRDTPMKTNGTAVFGLDKKLPGMLYATVERNPRLRGKIKSFDDSETRKVPGVKQVFKIRSSVFKTYREGVVVVATSTWAAMQGKKALKVEWDDSGFEHINTAGIYERQAQLLATEEGLLLSSQGQPNPILEAAQQKLDVVYQTPYQSHSCMEPLNCVAHYQEGKLEIWGPIQAPDWVQDFLSKEMHIPKKDVTVNMTFLGGGFGRKAFTDYPHEAALISKEIGAPVQVVWTREDDMTQGPYRPGISYRCEAVLTGTEISALKFRMSGQNNDHWQEGEKAKLKANESTSEGFLKPYFETIKNLSFAEVIFETPVPTMWWRSVYASTNGFAYESFMDEVAIAAHKDPLDFRRRYLQEARSQRLIDKLEAVSGWRRKRKNEGYGVAITECFGTTVGQVVKVSGKVGGGIKIDRVWAVVDCGWYVNPDIIRAQVEGSVVMALGAATTHEITFEDGLVQQRNFYDYKMPRITDVPHVEVHIMDNDEDAGGIGEPGVPPFAPALANAIFDLTGKRIRKLPFSLDSV